MAHRAAAQVVPEVLDVERVLASACVRCVEYHQEIDSTNNRALQLAANPHVACPLLVIAERQSAGRGRGAHRWWSPDGGLTFSVIAQQKTSATPMPQLCRTSLGAALAVRAAIEEILPGIPVRLKWPNDVYLMDRKVCGILVESTPARQERVVNGGSDSLMSHVPSSHLAQEGGGEVVNGCSGLRSQSASAIERTTLQVIGIGVNVNNSLRRAPRDLQARATSLTDAAGRVFDRTELLIRILRRLTLILQELHEDQFPLSDRWQSACMLQGRTICLESGGQSAIGVCQGIDDEGALLLQTEAGITRHLTGIVSSIL